MSTSEEQENYKFTKPNNEEKHTIAVPLSTLQEIMNNAKAINNDMSELMQANKPQYVEKANLVVTAMSRASFIVGAVKYYLQR